MCPHSCRRSPGRSCVSVCRMRGIWGMAAASSLMGEMAFCLSLPSFIDKVGADAHVVNIIT